MSWIFGWYMLIGCWHGCSGQRNACNVCPVGRDFVILTTTFVPSCRLHVAADTDTSHTQCFLLPTFIVKPPDNSKDQFIVDTTTKQIYRYLKLDHKYNPCFSRQHVTSTQVILSSQSVASSAIHSSTPLVTCITTFSVHSQHNLIFVTTSNDGVKKFCLVSKSHGWMQCSCTNLDVSWFLCKSTRYDIFFWVKFWATGVKNYK